MTAVGEPNQAIFDANIGALSRLCPNTAQALLDAEPPASLCLGVGRDGATTYAWRDGEGRQSWLGRTTMPTVRSRALIGAFQDGGRNVLLDGFGSGGEIDLLLRRLAPHQAVVALEADAWAVAASLRLYDFADDLRQGRLLIFTGRGAWTGLRDFLLSNDGFLTPERVLAWPWFDPQAVTGVSDRLSAVSSLVAQRRLAKLEEHRASREPRPAAADRQAIAVLSNVPSSNVRRFGARFSAAARDMGVACGCFVLDGPMDVHQTAVESAVWGAAPELVVLLDTMPGDLPYDLPPVPSLVACTHAEPLATEWMGRLPAFSVLGVMARRQHAAATESGIEPDRVIVLPAAACGASDNDGESLGRKVVVIADGHDISAKAAGLHLTTHRRLWEAATRILSKKCDAYRDEDVDAVLREAEKSLGFQIDSDEVRGGLGTRIRRILAPTAIRRAYCLALVEAGIDFDLYGYWDEDDVLAEYHKGAWPEPNELPEAMADCGLIVTIEPSGRIHPALLDGLALGLAGVVRTHPTDETADGLAAVLDPAKHIRPFDSRSSLVRLVRQFREEPASFQPQAAACARHINENHTWTHRLRTIIEAGRRLAAVKTA